MSGPAGHPQTPDELLAMLVKERDATLSERYPWATFGPGTYGGLQAMRWNEGTKLTVGAYTSFSFNVRVLCGGEHRMDWATMFPFSELWPEAKGIEGHPATRGDIVIGSDVWVGAEAMILSGVHIGHGAVIGARSLVTKAIPPYAIAVGSPATVIGRRFSIHLTDKLLGIAWWEWPRARIVKALPLLLNPKIDHFIDAVQQGEL